MKRASVSQAPRCQLLRRSPGFPGNMNGMPVSTVMCHCSGQEQLDLYLTVKPDQSRENNFRDKTKTLTYTETPFSCFSWAFFSRLCPIPTPLPSPTTHTHPSLSALRARPCLPRVWRATADVCPLSDPRHCPPRTVRRCCRRRLSPHGLHTRWRVPQPRGGPRRLPVLRARWSCRSVARTCWTGMSPPSPTLLCPLHRDGWQVDGGEARWCADALGDGQRRWGALPSASLGSGPWKYLEGSWGLPGKLLF